MKEIKDFIISMFIGTGIVLIFLLMSISYGVNSLYRRFKNES